MFIVVVPEIVRAPVVVKWPTTLGNPAKSYTPVMVTGMGEPADAVGEEAIVKKATMHTAIAAQQVLLCRTTNILFFMFQFSFLFDFLFLGLLCERALRSRVYPAGRGSGEVPGETPKRLSASATLPEPHKECLVRRHLILM